MVRTGLESTRLICTSRIGPFLSMVTPLECMRTMVEVSRRGEWPPSTTASIVSPNRRRTISAFVHGGPPVMFALVPVRSPPHFRISFNARGLPGHLTAIVFLRLVSNSGKRTLDLATMVSGPGQNLDASALALLSISAICCANFGEETRIGKGFLRLPFMNTSLPRAPGL